jgi:DNA repair protein RecO (recombination protein O)
MAILKDQAIVLRRLDYSESSQVLLFFTREHGSQRLIAKGVKRSTKKRYGTAIDLLERGHVAWIRKAASETQLGTLTEWKQINAYLGLRSELIRLNGAQYAAEITGMLTADNDPHPLLFDALAESLHTLASGRSALPAIVAYQQTVLQEVGLWPDFERCVITGRAAPAGRPAYYSATQGGLVSRDQAGTLREKRLIPAKVLDHIRRRDWADDVAEPIFHVFNYTISHAAGKPPATTRPLLNALPAHR